MNNFLKELDPKSPDYCFLRDGIKNLSRDFRENTFMFFDFNNTEAKNCFELTRSLSVTNQSFDLDLCEKNACFSAKKASTLFLVALYLVIDKRDDLSSFDSFLKKCRHLISPTEWRYFYTLINMASGFSNKRIKALKVLSEYGDIYDFNDLLSEMNNMKFIDFTEGNFLFRPVLTPAYVNLPPALFFSFCQNGKIEFCCDKIDKLNSLTLNLSNQKEDFVYFVKDCCLEEINKNNSSLKLTNSFLYDLMNKVNPSTGYSFTTNQPEPYFLNAFQDILKELSTCNRFKEVFSYYADFAYGDFVSSFFMLSYFNYAHLLLVDRPSVIIKVDRIPISYFYDVPQEFEFCCKIRLLSKIV